MGFGSAGLYVEDEPEDTLFAVSGNYLTPTEPGTLRSTRPRDVKLSKYRNENTIKEPWTECAHKASVAGIMIVPGFPHARLSASQVCEHV